MNTRRLDLIFAVLVAGTVLTWWMGLIIRDFMALRGVKFFWPAMVIGWLLLVLAIIMAAYWKGL